MRKVSLGLTAFQRRIELDYMGDLSKILDSIVGDSSKLLLKAQTLATEVVEDKKHYLHDVANLELALTMLMVAENAKNDDSELSNAFRVISFSPEYTRLIVTIIVAQYQTVLAKRLVDNG